jgi:hypothetical protein
MLEAPESSNNSKWNCSATTLLQYSNRYRMNNFKSE